MTDELGIASITFRAFTVAGTANITAHLNSTNGTFSNYTYVNIDHNIPYSLQFISYPNNATVGTAREIKIRMQHL